MRLDSKNVRRTINKAFLKEPIERGSFTLFKDALEELHNAIDVAKEKNEHEEHFKNFMATFFNRVGFEDYFINTSARIDMAIHTGKKGKDPVGVLIEAKRPGNATEMITKEQINRKAMHEAVLYYLEQRIMQDNSDLKHLIITDMDNWFIFDAQEFERCFYKPSALRKTWKEWKSDRKVSSNNDFMYNEISKFIDAQDISISGLWLPLDKTRKFLKGEKDSEYEKKLIPIFKLFTPTHLLKEPFANDSNSLNKEFYRELLYILGLEETKEGSTRYIQRASEENRNRGSVIENTIRILDAEDHLSTLSKSLSSYGATKDEQLFSVAMELSITWMNRVLFLKLLEAQLYRYHRQDKNFKFLNYQVIDSLDELNKLFFQVLARKEKDRSEDVNEKFGHIPYLNSSLFDVSSLEHQTTRISGLDDHAEIPVYGKSVLTKQRGETLNTLDYLFRFLEAYDFSAEGSEEIRDESKSLINASVLGLIFEKINGYKDGSFYTPGFITEYMARETLQKAVTDAFNKKYEWGCSSFDELYNEIHRERVPLKEANALINELKICDPAVGSGHFLVSCLNELIAIKSKLDILCDRSGKLLRQINVTVENDELIISWGDEGLFEYDVSHSWKGTRLGSRKISLELERVQETLFHEKRYLIENCLFGVDINPNSVKICRLRLWIELLKRAYYTLESNYMELEVLPNIDINIKQGNSLVSRFELDSDLSNVFKNSEYSLEDYKEAVRSYKHTGDRSEKQRLQQLIDDIKKEYSTTLTNIRPINQKISKARGKLQVMQSDDLFGDVKFTKKEIKKQEKKLKKLEEQKAEEESGAFYNQAFEWRFEFPEVLDEAGQFIGFDLVIANPPYVPLESFTKVERDFFRKKYSLVERKFETSILFLFRAFEISKANSPITFIAPVTWETGENYKKLRKYLFNEKSVNRIINLPFDIFEDAYVETGIFIFNNSTSSQYQIFNFKKKEKVEDFDNLDFTTIDYDLIIEPDYKVVLDPFWARIINRLEKDKFEQLGEITFSTQGLSGSRFEEKENKSEKFDYPFLSDGQVYNYEILVNKVTYTSLEDKSNLERFYQAEPKLLIRRIVNRRDRLDVGYTEEKLVVKKDINPFIIDNKKFIPKYVLGVMASRFVSAMYVNTSSIATKDDFRQTTLTELRNILIPVAKKADQEKIAKLAVQIITAKKQNRDADTTDLEAEIDRLVYELYGLSEEEVRVVEGSSLSF